MKTAISNIVLSVATIFAAVAVGPVTSVGQAPAAPNGPGFALGFDGVDDYLFATPPNLPSGNSGYTIEAWINPVFMRVGAIAAWGNFGATHQVNALALTNNGLSNYWWGNDLSVSTANLSAAWHHVAATYDGITRRILVDGVVAGRDFPQAHNPGVANFSIGSAMGGQFFFGGMDEVRIWNIGRSAVEIKADMRRQLVGNEPGLIAYWRLDEGKGAQAFDAGGNSGNTASLLNPAWAASAVMPFAPTVTTSSVSSVTSAKATLNGAVNPNSANTAAHFQWGTTTSYGNTGAAVHTAGAGTAPVNINETISGLIPGATYHFRAVALNDHGTSYGPDIAFTTPSVVNPDLIPPPNGPGQALSFDGAGENLEATPPALPTGNSHYTIEAWVRTAAMNSGTIVSWGNFGTNNGVNGLRLSPTGLVNYWWGQDLAVTTPSLTGSWHHVAATFDGLTRRIFVDGNFAGRDNPTGHNAAAGNFHIGAAGGFFTTEFFAGEMDELRIWNTARSGVEITAGMRRQLFGNENGLVAYWRFDEGGGTSAFDATGNAANTARLVGTPAWVPATITPFAPPVTTLTVSRLNVYSAFLTGMVDGRTSPAPFEAYFEWGTNESPRWELHGPVTIPSNAPPQNFSIWLNGLTPGETYYYRAVAVNQPGSSYGRTVAFHLPVPKTLTVMNKSDDGAGSLREAIQNAGAGDTILFAPEVTGTVSMTHGEMLIDKELTIVGPGAAKLTLSANQLSRIFKVAGPYGNATISGLTIRDGRSGDGVAGTASTTASSGAPGGGIYNSGGLTLTDCVLTNNRTGTGGLGHDWNLAQSVNSAAGSDAAAGGDGGAIYSEGFVVLTDCRIASNFAGNGGRGGHGGNRGPNFGLLKGGAGGRGGRGGKGGAIFVAEGGLTATNCTVAGNGSGWGGDGGRGGNGEDGQAAMGAGAGGDGGNGGDGGDGGGVYLDFPTGGSFSTCALYENTTGRGGDGGRPGLGDNGANRGGSSRGGQGGNGGGVASISRARMDIIGCTVAHNSAGNGGDGDLVASDSHGGKGGDGGAIYSAVKVYLGSCTLSQNAAGEGGNGGQFSGNGGDGGAIHASAGPSTLVNTLVAWNFFGAPGSNALGQSGTPGQGPNLFGSFDSAGHNLIAIADGSSGFAYGMKGDLVGAGFSPIDPLLGPLEDNGGPTLTMALRPGSPAIDAGDDKILYAEQRGFPRKLGAHVDIGALETGVLRVVDIRFDGPNVDISFTTDGPFTYWLESKATLGPGAWTAVQGSQRTGNGAILTVSVPRPPGALTQFYRAVMKF